MKNIAKNIRPLAPGAVQALGLDMSLFPYRAFHYLVANPVHTPKSSVWGVYNSTLRDEGAANDY